MQKLAKDCIDKFCALLFEYINGKMQMPESSVDNNEVQEHQPQVLEGL